MGVSGDDFSAIFASSRGPQSEKDREALIVDGFVDAGRPFCFIFYMCSEGPTPSTTTLEELSRIRKRILDLFEIFKRKWGICHPPGTQRERNSASHILHCAVPFVTPLL